MSDYMIQKADDQIQSGLNERDNLIASIESLEQKLKIAVAALEKLKNDRSPQWDNLDWRRVATEALEKLKDK